MCYSFSSDLVKLVPRDFEVEGSTTTADSPRGGCVDLDIGRSFWKTIQHEVHSDAFVSVEYSVLYEKTVSHFIRYEYQLFPSTPGTRFRQHSQERSSKRFHVSDIIQAAM